jgi:hypothetical protein
VGADVIRAFLVYLDMPEGVDPYYLRRAGPMADRQIHREW